MPWTVATADLYPQDLPGKNTEVGRHCLLQGIFHLQHWQSGFFTAEPAGKPIEDADYSLKA